MDKELIGLLKARKQIEELKEKIRIISCDLRRIKEIEWVFKNEESKQAIREIKEYFKEMQQENSNNNIRLKEMELEDKITEKCPHELLYKKDSIDSKDYCCLICGRKIKKDEINFDCLILTSEKEYYLIYYYVTQIINKILETNNEILDLFCEYKEQEINLSNIKVYRRQNEKERINRDN